MEASPDLALPVGRVDQHDAVRQVVIRHQDVVQLVVHRLPGDLEDRFGPALKSEPPSGAAVPASYLQVAARVQGPLVVQAVGPFVLRPAGLPLLQGGAPASPARQLGLLPAGQVRHDQSLIRDHQTRGPSLYRLDAMIRDSVLVILPLGGSLSKNVSMLSISSSVVGVTASGGSCRTTREAEEEESHILESPLTCQPKTHIRDVFRDAVVWKFGPQTFAFIQVDL